MKGVSAPKSRRRCLFCGSVDGLTREHVWPRWIVDVLPDGHRWTTRTRVGLVDGQPHVETGEPYGARDSCSWTARVACGECNNGWMSRLEEEAKPVIGPLLRGEDLAVDGVTSSSISRWCVKTAIVLAAGAGQPWIPDPAMAAALRSGAIPAGQALVSVAKVPIGLDGWTQVANVVTHRDEPAALFVDAIRGQFAFTAALAPSSGPMPGWHVLMPHDWTSLLPHRQGGRIAGVGLEQVWAVALARLQLMTMFEHTRLRPI